LAAGQGGVGDKARRPDPVSGQVDPRQPGGVDRRPTTESAPRRSRCRARNDHTGEETAGHHVFLPNACSSQVGSQDGAVHRGFGGTITDGGDDRLARWRLAGRRRLDRRVHRGINTEEITRVWYPPQASVETGGCHLGTEVAPSRNVFMSETYVVRRTSASTAAAAAGPKPAPAIHCDTEAPA
jgi:hypothetical protein